MPRPSRKQHAGAPLILPPIKLDRSRKVSDQIYAWLRDAILTMALPPGTPLSEFELGAAITLSRTPVREALKRLEMEGLVATYPSLGSVVSKIKVSQIEQAVILRSLLEGEAAARAAACANSREIARVLGQICKQQAKAVKIADLDAIYACDEQFHETLFAMTRLDLLWTTVRQARTVMQRLRALTLRDPINRATASGHHHELAAAVLAKDADLARSIMATHVTSNRWFLDRIRDINQDYLDFSE